MQQSITRQSYKIGAPGGYKAQEWLQMQAIACLLCYIWWGYRPTVKNRRTTQQPTGFWSWFFLVLCQDAIRPSSDAMTVDCRTWSIFAVCAWRRRSKWHRLEKKQVSTAQMPTEFVFEVHAWMWHSPFLLRMNATAPLNHSHTRQSTLCTLTVAAVCDMSIEWAWINHNWSRSGLLRSGTSEQTPIWTKMSPEVFQLFYSNIYLSPIGIFMKVCRLIDRYRS